jgi:hypothetical protein
MLQPFFLLNPLGHADNPRFSGCPRSVPVPQEHSPIGRINSNVMYHPAFRASVPRSPYSECDSGPRPLHAFRSLSEPPRLRENSDVLTSCTPLYFAMIRGTGHIRLKTRHWCGRGSIISGLSWDRHSSTVLTQTILTVNVARTRLVSCLSVCLTFTPVFIARNLNQPYARSSTHACINNQKSIPIYTMHYPVHKPRSARYHEPVEVVFHMIRGADSVRVLRQERLLITWIHDVMRN